MIKSPVGVILAHLGTPEAPTTEAVRRYLAEFLADQRVVDLPRWQWLPILYGIILTLRPKRSAAAYRRTWRDAGSPLMITAREQQHALQKALGTDFQVTIAMRYGSPSIDDAIKQLESKQCRRIVLLPMYPQYSATTTASVHDAWMAALQQRRDLPEYHFIRSYHDHPAYIKALAASVERHWQQHGQAEKLLISFHGIPQRYANAGDPYPVGCQQTAQLLVKALKLDPQRWQLAFQSRLGREPWLTPYTDQTLQQLASDGIRTVDVICPGFSSDCLETLDEIAHENAELFVASGGKHLNYIPALNDHPDHIALLQTLVTNQDQ